MAISPTRKYPKKAIENPHLFSMRPNVEGPLFCHMNNQNLTRYQFSKMLRNALAFTGYSPDEFNTHSLHN
jgi:hypothetical protein